MSDIRSEKISQAIERIDPSMLESADTKRSELISIKERKAARLRKIVLSIGSAAACLMLIAGVYAVMPKNTNNLPIDHQGDPSLEDNTVTTPPADSLNDGYLSGSFHTGTYTPPSTAAPESETPLHTTAISNSADTISTTDNCYVDESSPKGENPPVTLNAAPIAEVNYPTRHIPPEYNDYLSEDCQFDLEAYNNAMDNYIGDNIERVNQAESPSLYFDFYKSTASKILSSSDNKNMVYSPANTYLALSVLAECTDGSTRKELLDLLGADDITALRRLANGLFTSNYMDFSKSKQLLANSIWLDSKRSYNLDTIKTIAENHFAETYSGDPSDEKFARMIGKWIDMKTGSLLKEKTGDMRLDEDTIIDICSTVYFKASWGEQYLFSEHGVFNSPDGEEEAEFMKLTSIMPYYRGKNYGAIMCDFEGDGYRRAGSKMWFILPDEKASLNEVAANGEYLDMIEEYVSADGCVEDPEMYNIIRTVPMFDISSDIDLVESFKELGLNSVFDPSGSDFSPLTDTKDVFVSSIQNAARVRIDKEGCEAAAYVNIAAPTEAPYEPVYEDLEFTLDRPFIFVITSDVGQPLFIGVVSSVEDLNAGSSE